MQNRSWIHALVSTKDILWPLFWVFYFLDSSKHLKILNLLNVNISRKAQNFSFEVQKFIWVSKTMESALLRFRWDKSFLRIARSCQNFTRMILINQKIRYWSSTTVPEQFCKHSRKWKKLLTHAFKLQPI